MCPSYTPTALGDNAVVESSFSTLRSELIDVKILGD